MIVKPFREPVWATKIRKANAYIEAPLLDETIYWIARQRSRGLADERGFESQSLPSVEKRISLEELPPQIPEPSVFEALIRSTGQETAAFQTGIGDMNGLMSALVALFAFPEQGLGGIGLRLDPAFPISMLHHADAEWRRDNSRSLEEVLASTLDLYVVPQFADRLELHEVAMKLFKPMLPTAHAILDRHLAAWTGYTSPLGV